MLETFYIAVEKFIAYQKKIFPDMTEDNDNGEWVFGDEFENMSNAYLEIVKNVPCSNATDILLDNMLYSIARDSECNNLVNETLEYPKWFALLCKYSLQTNYTNAKWQFAEYLPEYREQDDVRDLIFSFLDCGN